MSINLVQAGSLINPFIYATTIPGFKNMVFDFMKLLRGSTNNVSSVKSKEKVPPFTLAAINTNQDISSNTNVNII